MAEIDAGGAGVQAERGGVPGSNRVHIQDREGSFKVRNLQNHPSLPTFFQENRNRQPQPLTRGSRLHIHHAPAADRVLPPQAQARPASRLAERRSLHLQRVRVQSQVLREDIPQTPLQEGLRLRLGPGPAGDGDPVLEGHAGQTLLRGIR